MKFSTEVFFYDSLAWKILGKNRAKHYFQQWGLIQMSLTPLNSNPFLESRSHRQQSGQLTSGLGEYQLRPLDTKCYILQRPQNEVASKSRTWVPKGAFMWCCPWGPVATSLENVVTWKLDVDPAMLCLAFIAWSGGTHFFSLSLGSAKDLHIASTGRKSAQLTATSSSRPVQVGPKDQRHIWELPGACKKGAEPAREYPLLQPFADLQEPPHPHSEQQTPLPLTQLALGR